MSTSVDFSYKLGNFITIDEWEMSIIVYYNKKN